MSKILIFGASGQLGSSLTSVFRDHAPISLDRTDADFQNPAQVIQALEKHQPRWVFNAAGYTDVERAETEEELARVANAETPGAVAHWCTSHGASFFHVSTDFVFSGKGQKPWKEGDDPRPLSAYGRTKWEGEKRVLSAIRHDSASVYVFRTSWVYSPIRNNFVKKILSTALQKEVLQVVDEEIGCPTYAPDLAGALQQAWRRLQETQAPPSGTYHLCNSGSVSRFELAQAIVQGATERGFPLRAREILPVPAGHFPTAARRPKNSVLDTTLVRTEFGIQMRPWQQALNDCLDAIQIAQRAQPGALA